MDKFKGIKLNPPKGLSNEELILFYENLKQQFLEVSFDMEGFLKSEDNLKLTYQWIIKILSQYNRPQVFNRELVANEKGSIFVSNHTDSYDQFYITYALKNILVHYLGKEKLLTMTVEEYLGKSGEGIIRTLKEKFGVPLDVKLDDIVGDYYKQIGMLWVDENNMKSKVNALYEMTQMSLQGGNLFVFPEGTRNNESFMLPFNCGVAKVAQITGKPINTLAVESSNFFKGANPLVRFGEPVYVAPSDNIDETTQRLWDMVAVLKLENMLYRNYLIYENEETLKVIDGIKERGLIKSRF